MLIGISGKKGSGKTTTADYLVTAYDFKRIALADKLKYICDDLLGTNRNRKSNQDVETYQAVGNYFRSIDPDVWIRAATKVLDLDDDNYVIDDIRYINEAMFVKNNGGKLIRVMIDYDTRFARLESLYGQIDHNVLAHESETALDGCIGNFDVVMYTTTRELVSKIIDSYMGLWNIVPKQT